MEKWNFIKRFCRLLENTEVPPRFAIWCGVAALLGALERRVWINQGIYVIYPNFYLVLVAASGQKKSTAVNLTGKLLRRLTPGPNVISQKITPEALITAIQEHNTNTQTKVLENRVGGLVIADELVTFLDKNSLDKGLGPLLTALYDCTPFEYRTLKRGIETIKNGYLSILGGSTIELLKSALPKDAIGGGLTSRTMFVYDDAIPPPVPWIEYDETLEEIEDELVQHLQRLYHLDGPVTVSPEAKQIYIDDYNKRHANQMFRFDPFLRNYENRRHSHLFKVAMAMMVAEEPRTSLEAHHLTAALNLLEEAETYLPKVMELLTSTDLGHLGSMILTFIASKPSGRTRLEIARQYGHRADSQDISKVLENLLLAGRIEAGTIEGRVGYRAI